MYFNIAGAERAATGGQILYFNIAELLKYKI